MLERLAQLLFPRFDVVLSRSPRQWWRHSVPISLFLGLLLAFCGLPTPWSLLTPLPLAMLLSHLSVQNRPRDVAVHAWWAIFAYFAVQLSWLVAFMHNLMVAGGLPGLLAWPLAALALSVLFALEGVFWALMAWLVARLLVTPAARLWGLAGGWVILEWLRTLGALAFPWSGLGYTALDTPLMQVADLGGVLLLSLIMAASAAALVSLRSARNPRPLLLMGLVWVVGFGYGLTRTPGEGMKGQAMLLRTDEDSFGKATGNTFYEQWAVKLRLSAQRRDGEVVVWSETAVPRSDYLAGGPDSRDPEGVRRLPGVPAPGIYGLYQQPRNTAVGWDGQRITGSFDKAHPVPMGEYFPLSGALNGLYTSIYHALGFPSFDPQFPAQSYPPILLNNVLYGVYICYDSIVGQVAQQLTRQGAQVLVNISNDGWYTGWGVWQHFDMGRVRAIENRRWVLRSVNKGVAAVIDDLGRPVQTLMAGEGVLHAEYIHLGTQTLYARFGDLPALVFSLLLIGYGFRLDRRPSTLPPPPAPRA
jgi:apolipoprotein N-acyltransferase